MRLCYKNRKTNIMKKGEELSTLCDVKVCVIVISPDGNLETWPENLNDVKTVVSAIKGSNKSVRSEYNPKKKKDHEDPPKPITVNDDVVGADVKGKGICIGNSACVVKKGPETSYGVSARADQENIAKDEDVLIIDNMKSFCHSPTLGAMPLFEDIWSDECPSMNMGMGMDMMANQEDPNSHYADQPEIGGGSDMVGSISSINNSGLVVEPTLDVMPLFEDIWSGECPAMNMGMDMMANQEYPNSHYANQPEIGGSSDMVGSSSSINNSGLVVQPNQHPHPCYPYGSYQWHTLEDHGVNEFPAINMVVNQEEPLSDVSLGVDIWSDVLNQQPSFQYGNQQIGGSSAMNSSFAHYDQFEIGSSSGYAYEIGSCSYINSGVAHPNQPPSF